MIPHVLIQLAWIVIIVRSVYRAVSLAGQSKKPWLDIAFYISIALVALAFLL